MQAFLFTRLKTENGSLKLAQAGDLAARDV